MFTIDIDIVRKRQVFRTKGVQDQERLVGNTRSDLMATVMCSFLRFFLLQGGKSSPSKILSFRFGCNIYMGLNPCTFYLLLLPRYTRQNKSENGGM
jgi:hypothetical protein